MKTVCALNMCCGCMACVDICPKGAITVSDDIRAYNAVIDQDKCIACNACHNICQSNLLPQFRENILVKQGWACDDRIRVSSASGGFAAAIEHAFIQSYGVAYSCCFADGQFSFMKAETEADLAKLKGSKYVKSSPAGVYRKIKSDLSQGKKVLFVGLPCQVAAVMHFCREHTNLYTIDLICHGTPSPKLLNMFLQEHSIESNGVKSIQFRNKTVFGIAVNEKAVSHRRLLDWYTFCFLNGCTYTENCYSCKYARKERVSDITLGDSWGSNLPEAEQHRGISLLMAQTQKGIDLIAKSNLQLFDVDFQNAIAHNQQLARPAQIPAERKSFFKHLDNRCGFTAAVARAYPIPYCKRIIKSILLKVHLIK